MGVSRDVASSTTGNITTRRIGTKLYELTDHLGSVRALIPDIKLPSGDTFLVEPVSVYEYDAYGVMRVTRSADLASPYRYGFQGMLRMSEVSSSNTVVNDYSTLFRTYDARTGRWTSHDPILQPWESTYSGLAGNPAMLTDWFGLDADDGGSMVTAMEPQQTTATNTTTTTSTTETSGSTDGATETQPENPKVKNSSATPSEEIKQPKKSAAEIKSEMEYNSRRKIIESSPGHQPGDVLEDFHDFLLLTGYVPVIGIGADAVNGIIYAVEGRFAEAGVSLVSAVPVAGDAAGTVLKVTIKVTKTTSRATKITRAVATARALATSQAVFTEIHHEVERFQAMLEGKASDGTSEPEDSESDGNESPAKSKKKAKGPKKQKSDPRNYKFFSKEEMARRLGVTVDKYHHAIKKRIVKDHKAILNKKRGLDNPDIGVDDAGNVVFKDLRDGSTIPTNTPLSKYHARP
ncbi:MAG TPA: hypothetical protein DIS79_11335 [Bacteroidetes bacterium]|nr:hypothetical protein [Bacteroidota bacterium]